jgi:hypothetical protein
MMQTSGEGEGGRREEGGGRRQSQSQHDTGLNPMRRTEKRQEMLGVTLRKPLISGISATSKIVLAVQVMTPSHERHSDSERADELT